MYFLILLFSIFNPNSDFQQQLIDNSFEHEYFFQSEKHLQKGDNKNKIGCSLSFIFHNKNDIKLSSKYLKYCKALGKDFSEITNWLDIKNNFYLNSLTDKKIEDFIKKYEKSTFLKEVKLYKIRNNFKKDNFKKAYNSYLSFEEENKYDSPQQEQLTEYIKAYTRTKYVTDDFELFVSNLNLLLYKKFLSDYQIKQIKESFLKFSPEIVFNNIEKILQDEKWNYFEWIMVLIRKSNPKLFGELLKYSDKIEKYEKIYLSYKLNVYNYKSKDLSFEEKEKYFDDLIEELKDKKDYSEDDLYKLLYQKAVLYHNAQKNLKRVDNYKEILKIESVSKSQKANYVFKSGLFLYDEGKVDDAINYFETVIKDYRYSAEYSQSVWMLFKIYKEKNSEKNDTTEKIKEYWELLKKTSFKNESYYYALKEKLFEDEEEKEKYLSSFESSKHSVYSKILFKNTIETEKSYEEWEKLTKYEKIDYSIEQVFSKDESLKKITKFLKNIDDISYIKSFYELQNYDMAEYFLEHLYDKIYKIVYKDKEKDLDEDELEFKKKIKAVKDNYMIHFLNYFIASKNYQYLYVILNRHFGNFASKSDSVYKNYFHPLAYFEYIDKYCKMFNLNPLIVLSIMETESIFNPTVISSAGAIGLMQIMPQTAESIAKKLNIKNYDMFNPEDNIHFGVFYLSKLVEEFHNQIPFAAASYNGGPHNVSKWIKNNKDKDLKLDEMIDEIGFKESRLYAHKILRLFSTYRKIYQNKDTKIPVHVNYKEGEKLGF